MLSAAAVYAYQHKNEDWVRPSEQKGFIFFSALELISKNLHLS